MEIKSSGKKSEIAHTCEVSRHVLEWAQPTYHCRFKMGYLQYASLVQSKTEPNFGPIGLYNDFFVLQKQENRNM